MTIAAMIATDDPSITDELLRLAAAADVEIELVHEAEHARRNWHWPSLILVGGDLAEAIASDTPDRRPGVAVVAAPGDTTDHYRRAVEIGAQDVVRLPDDETWLIDALAAAAEPAEGWGTTVCVLGATGGAGASVLSAALGLTAAGGGLRTLLVDGDPIGGGLDLVLGLEEQQGARWPHFAERHGRLSAANLYEALPRLGDLSVLSWHRGAPTTVVREATASLLDAAVRAFDLVIADVPRYQGEIGRSVLHLAETTLVLVPAEVRATMAADGLVSALRDDARDMRLVVRGPTTGGVTPELMAEALDLPLAGVLDRERKLPGALETGELVRSLRRGSLADFCARLLASLNVQPYEQAAA
ncbi:septum site-determining protein Ssd [Actinomadura sp. 9N407]|uniref:septum site-determining protein Ssd n=1 Tax=Actinomadura sp. 9N407 TaxID=3375154 RepID=UPI003799F12B